MADRRSTKEEWILKKAANGDPSAMGRLVESHTKLAYTVAIRLLHNRQDAEEVVQDSFMKAFASLHRFNNASSFSTWLYRIVYNTALTKLGKRKRNAAYSKDFQTEWTHSHDHNKGWEQLLKNEKLKYIEMAMESLSEEDRFIFILHYTGGKTISEIGRILDLKKSTIKMRLSRGRKLLKEQLEVLLGNETNELI